MQQPRQGNLRHGNALAPGNVAHHIHAVEGPRFIHRREVKFLATATALHLPVAAVFAAQQTARQRAPDHQPDTFALQHRHQLTLQVTSGKGVIGL